MEHTLTKHNDTMVVALKGAFTFTDQDSFRMVLASIDDSNVTAVTLDLSALTSIDSTGLGLLMVARNSAAVRNITIRLQGATGQVKRLLSLGKLDELMESSG